MSIPPKANGTVPMVSGSPRPPQAKPALPPRPPPVKPAPPQPAASLEPAPSPPVIAMEVDDKTTNPIPDEDETPMVPSAPIQRDATLDTLLVGISERAHDSRPPPPRSRPRLPLPATTDPAPEAPVQLRQSIDQESAHAFIQAQFASFQNAPIPERERRMEATVVGAHRQKLQVRRQRHWAFWPSIVIGGGLVGLMVFTFGPQRVEPMPSAEPPAVHPMAAAQPPLVVPPTVSASMMLAPSGPAATKPTNPSPLSAGAAKTAPAASASAPPAAKPAPSGSFRVDPDLD